MALAPYAMDAGRSRGRRHPEQPHPYRNDYARDRDRVIHARAFRRLQDKPQVFTARFSDHFRSRLTHTLEVAQIARTVAGALELNADLAEALALVHDIGHPPFGHSGEQTLDALMRGFGARFDHNLHALRIVEQFEQRYLDFPGLNLTFEVREGIVKHSHEYNLEEFPELAEYLLGERPPLEAQIIDLVDEIAYNIADLDDGLEAELLEVEAVLTAVPAVAGVYGEIDRGYPNARTKLKFLETLKRLLDVLVTDLIDTTQAGIARSGVRSVEEVRRAPARIAGLSPAAAEKNAALKSFLHARLYALPELAEERERSALALDHLFRFFLDRPEAMPPFYAQQAHRQPRHRVVCDYIAGMTDRFLLRQHAALVEPNAEVFPKRR